MLDKAYPVREGDLMVKAPGRDDADAAGTQDNDAQIQAQMNDRTHRVYPGTDRHADDTKSRADDRTQTLDSKEENRVPDPVNATSGERNRTSDLGIMKPTL